MSGATAEVQKDFSDHFMRNRLVRVGLRVVRRGEWFERVCRHSKFGQSARSAFAHGLEILQLAAVVLKKVKLYKSYSATSQRWWSIW